MPGLFLTFEGIDGCGKTTQMRLLMERLRAAGHATLENAEPGGTRIGVEVRRILLDGRNRELSPVAELLLYFACRAQNIDERIRPALARGEIVVSDRFTDSTLAYQGSGRNLGEDVVMQLHKVACRGVEPELTILIDIDLADSLARARARNVETQSTETRLDDEAFDFHRRVRDTYLRLAAAEPNRIVKIDGRRSIEAIAEDVWAVVRSRF